MKGKSDPANTGPLVVVNAGSGKSAGSDRIGRLRARLDQSGREFELLPIRRGRDVPPTAREAAALARTRKGVLVVCGGDGTINAVGQHAVNDQLALGVIPGGTFNYLSRTLGIPQDFDAAIDCVLNEAARPTHAGLLNDRIFFVNASVGLYPRLLEDREAYKQRFGRSRLVAIWSALATLFHQHRQLEIELDVDGTPQRLRTPTLFVGNNRLQLEQVGVSQGRQLDHDRLVAITAKPLRIATSIGLMVRAALGRLGDAPEVKPMSFRQLTMRTRRFSGRRRIKVATDGEIAYLPIPLVFRPSPKPLWIIAPPDGRAE